MLESRKVFAITLSVLLLVTSYILLFVNFKGIKSQGQWIQHSQLVTNKIGSLRVQKQFVDKTVYRALAQYSEGLKVSFGKAKDSSNYLVKQLQGLVEDNEAVRSAVELDLKPALNVELNAAQRSFNLLADSSIQMSQRLQVIEGYNAVLDKNGVVSALDKLLQSEKNILQNRQERLTSSSNKITYIILISLAVAVYFIMMAVFLFIKEFNKRKKLTLQSEEYKLELEKQVVKLEKANSELSILKNQEKFSSTGRIARTIAHEIRNPLTNINLASEQIKDLLPENDEAEMLCNMVNRNSTRINELIGNLLNATRFLEIKDDELNVNKLLDEALAQASDRIQLLEISTVKEYDQGLCTIKGDGEKIKIAFLNIIVNAVEAMPNQGGVLTLKTSEDKYGRCKILISDNGRGMNEEVQQKLFDPFFTSKQKGTGLGLTNTQNIINAHKGQINVKSKIGEGTTFEILI